MPNSLGQVSGNSNVRYQVYNKPRGVELPESPQPPEARPYNLQLFLIIFMNENDWTGLAMFFKISLQHGMRR